MSRGGSKSLLYMFLKFIIEIKGFNYWTYKNEYEHKKCACV